jgi:hypothetical protein
MEMNETGQTTTTIKHKKIGLDLIIRRGENQKKKK